MSAWPFPESCMLRCFACRAVYLREVRRTCLQSFLHGFTFGAVPQPKHDWDALWAEHQRLFLAEGTGEREG